VPDSRFSFVPDLPSVEPVLGFATYADALAHAIAETEPAQFTVGIYGPWGSGKSSLLKAIAARLEAAHPDTVIVVEFDAWRYQRNQELVVPLLHAVYRKVAEKGEESLAAAAGRLMRAVALSLSFRLPVVGRDVSLGEIKEAWSEADTLDAALDEAFALPFENLRTMGQRLGNRRIVILVDDLDRCSVDTVTAMLESINAITDVAGFVFVLALDYDVIVRAVNAKYPTVNGHQFVEKIIQVPFRIPGLDASEDALLPTLVPAMDLGKDLSTGDAELARMVDLAFGANPRSTKRLSTP
jgi:predicted KAP-like P-loop ATPase